MQIMWYVCILRLTAIDDAVSLAKLDDILTSSDASNKQSLSGNVINDLLLDYVYYIPLILWSERDSAV
jgi:hypothetical protein